MQEADALAPTAPGAYEGSTWSELVVLQPGTPTQYQSSTKAGKRRRLAAAKRRRGSASGGEGGGGGEDGEGAAAPSQAWLQQTEQALQVGGMPCWTLLFCLVLLPILLSAHERSRHSAAQPLNCNSSQSYSDRWVTPCSIRPAAAAV